MLFAVVGVWYVLTAFSFFVLFDFSWKSLVWAYYAKNDSFIALYLVSSLCMLFVGYALRYWELSEWKGELDRWEKRLDGREKELEKWAREFKRLKKEKEELTRSVNFLSAKRSALLEEVKELSHKKSVLDDKVSRLQEELKNLDRKMQEAEERGCQEGYNRIIQELRALRAQKTAVLDLFDRFYELGELLKAKIGMDIRGYLNSVKKKVKEGYDAAV